MSTNKEILKEIDHLMLAAFHKASGYGETLFHAQPEQGKWSLQQVLHHIWFAANGSLKVMKNKMGKADTLKDTSIESTLRSYFLKLMLFLPFNYKAPKEVSVVPNNVSFDELKANWDQTVAGFSELIDLGKGDLEKKLVFKHPIAGWFTLNQTLTFILDHLEHHQKQLEGLYSWLDTKK
jgi:superfamily I DNA and/or RNA helicase